jgi:hypothetical protein
MKHLNKFNEMFGLFKRDEEQRLEWVESDGNWVYGEEGNLPKTYIPCIIKLKDKLHPDEYIEKSAYLEYNKPPYRFHDKSEMSGAYLWVITSNYHVKDISLNDVVAWRYKNPGGERLAKRL